MSISVIDRVDGMVLQGSIAAHQAVSTGIENVQALLQRKYDESRVAWFAIALAAIVFFALAIGAYLTVQCWSRGYRGFSGVFNWHFTSWTHIDITMNFMCV